jgi:hypothetical protein
MENVGYAALGIIPSFDGFQGHLERGATGPLTAAGRTGGTAFGNVAGKSAGTRFGTVFKSTIAALGLYQLGRAGLNFLQDSVGEAREAQKVGALTEQVIRSTGGAAKVTAKQVEELAGALSLKSGIDDEVIQRGANMLLTFKNVRNEVGKNNDIFDQSVAITEDMAASMAGGMGGQIDLKSASLQVGKALNDPIKGVTALGRAGVQFTDQQKKQIETLVKHNDMIGAQKIVLGELKDQFGGAAREQATLGEKVDVAWGNIQEKLGTALLPLIDDVERYFLKKGVPAAERFSDWFTKTGAPAIKDFVDDAKPFIESAMPAAATVLGDVKDAAKQALPVVKGVIDAFNDMPDWAQKAIAVGGASAIVGSKLGLGSVLKGSGSGGGLLGAFTKSSPMPVYVVNSLPGGGVGGLPGGGKTPGLLGSPNGTLLGAAVPALGFGLANAAYEHPDGIINPSDVGSAADFQKWVDTKAMAEQMATIFKTLPEELQTKITLEGAPESRRAAMELAETYDLTKRERTTLFRTSGIPLSDRQVADLINLYDDAARPRRGSIDVDTSAAQRKAEVLLATLNNINRMAAINASRDNGGGRRRRVHP